MTIAPQHRLYSCFFLFAVTTGALMSRLPDIQTDLGVSESQLGLTMIGMSIGSLISLTFGAAIIERLGVRTTAFLTVLGPALLFALIPWLGAAPLVFAALFVTGLLSGALEINLNVEIDRLEMHTGSRFMNRAHGFWSVGFFVTALAGASIRQSGLSVQWHLALVALVVVLVGGFMISGIRPAPAPKRTESENTHRIAFPNLGLVPLCIIGFAAFLVEGAGIDWSAIYMRDVFAVQPFIGGMGLTLFAFFMAVMRLSADPVVARFGPRNVAMVLLILATLGALMVGFAPSPSLALAGFALMGIGCSAVYPLAVSAAAQRTDRPAAVNVAALGQVSFVVFFLAPPLLGFVAEYLGIRNSYLVCVPLLLAGLWAANTALGNSKSPAPADLRAEPVSPHA
jgi:MFS family permease